AIVPAPPTVARPAARSPSNKFRTTAATATSWRRDRGRLFAPRQERRCLRAHLPPRRPWPPCWSIRFCRNDEDAHRTGCRAAAAGGYQATADQEPSAVDIRLRDAPPHPHPSRAIAESGATLRNDWKKSPGRSWSRWLRRWRSPSASARSAQGGDRWAGVGALWILLRPKAFE